MNIKVAGIQMGATGSKEENVEKAGEMLERLVTLDLKPPFYYFGRSMIVDPWGIELAKAANKECIISAELDLDYLREMRKERDVFAHRRPDLYEL